MINAITLRAKPQNDISGRHRQIGALNSNAFNNILSVVPEPSRVGQQKRNAVESNRHFDQITRRPGNVGDNRGLARQQRIQ